VLAATESVVSGVTPRDPPSAMVEAFRAVLRAASDPEMDKSLLAYALTLPDELTLLGEMDVMRPVSGAMGGGAWGEEDNDDVVVVTCSIQVDD
jgi:hypothetical protein